ncbi:hypothetical protein ACIRF8_33860 [Streptomyces sp. NPDC102406]|uniref:hypothetical protein n=1 Tax=Streptomyces sp. NPDC102406 TaxID=3366171 RepID=UPI00382439A6
MNMLSSGLQMKTAGADSTVPTRPSRAALVIEELDSVGDHMVALSTFCILAEAAVPAAARRVGRLDA